MKLNKIQEIAGISLTVMTILMILIYLYQKNV